MMMNSMVHPQKLQLPIDEITSPLGAQFEFSESELFPEPLANNSEVGSINSSNNCNYDQEDSSYNYPTNLSINIDSMNSNNYTTTAAAATPPPTTENHHHHHHPMFFEDGQLDNNNISASIDFTPSPPSFLLHNQPYNNNGQEVLFSTFDDDIGISLGEGAGVQPELYKEEGGFSTCMPHQLPSYNVRLMSSAPSGLVDHMNASSGPYFPMNGPFLFDSFTGGTGLFLGGDHLSNQELEFEGDNVLGGVFPHGSMAARVFNCSAGDVQGVSSESQHLLNGSPSTALVASDISSLEDPNMKVGKLSPEERKRKILRYLKKRNERNFSKKIKYACRKTLADSRPRVRGRFAKNDELAELARAATCNKLGDDTDEDAALFANPYDPDHQNKVAKEEEVMESDIFAHISGVNSFKCNYPIQSWI